MTGIHSRARQLSLSIAGILVVILFVGTACVPEELRADVASRMAGLAEDLDATLTDAWHLTFSARGSDHPAVASADQKGGGSHPAALTGVQAPILTGVQAPMATSGGSGLVVMNGLGSGTFDAAYGVGSASNSMAGLLSDVFKENALGANGGFEAFGASSAGGANAPLRSGGAGDRFPAGIGGSAGGGASASPSHGSSNPSTREGSTASDSPNSEGTLRVAGVKPDAQNLYPDAHPDRSVNLEGGFGSLTDWAGASANQVRPNDPVNALFGGGPSVGGPAVNDRNGGLHDGTSNLDPVTGDPVSLLLSGLDHPLQGEDARGSVLENEANGGGGDGQILDFNDTPASGGDPEDHGLLGKPVELISSVPEPGSFALLSLGLGAVILWRQFRPAP